MFCTKPDRDEALASLVQVIEFLTDVFRVPPLCYAERSNLQNAFAVQTVAFLQPASFRIFLSRSPSGLCRTLASFHHLFPPFAAVRCIIHRLIQSLA